MLDGWVPAAASFIIQLIVAVYVYGKLSQSVSDHGHRITRIEDEQDDQWTSISSIAQIAAELRGRVRHKDQ